jgi:hypothetical protein
MYRICSNGVAMNDQVSKAELDALRSRVAELEAARADPVKVEIEGLDGLKAWSRAVENKDLDNFYLNHSVPDRQFWWPFWGFVAIGIIVIAAALIELAVGAPIFHFS